MNIHTIGHSNRKIGEFIDVLRLYEIETVVDVRRFPVSKFSHFDKKNLAEHLPKSGINYFHLENLGGYRGSYIRHMKSKTWKDSFERLKVMALKSSTVIMCAEKLPWKCHRRFIALKLQEQGWQVIHILNHKTWIDSRRLSEFK